MANKDFEIAEMMSQISRRIYRRSRQLPIAPHQSRALRLIAHGDVRPARLAEALGITPRAVTDVVDALSDARLVTVGQDPTDRRAKVISITDTGRRHLKDVQTARADIASELLDVLDPKEKESLAAVLKKIMENAGA